MQVKQILVFSLLAFWSHALLGQNLKISLADADSGRPLADVAISVQETGATAYTDDAGNAVLANLPAGTYHLLCRSLGYEPLRHVLDYAAENMALALRMQPTGISIAEVLVEGGLSQKKEVISQLDISLRPLNNSQEILRMVPGLFIGQHAGGGKAEQIFLRGFDIDHGTDIQITVDGMPVNMVSHAHGQGYADLHFVMPELVERVDFGKGPYLAEKGNFTTAGWVDFRTKNTLDNNILKVEVGQFDTYRAFGAVSLLKDEKKAEGRSAYIAAEYNFSNSFFDAPQGFNRFNAQFKYNDKLGANTQFTLSASHFSSEWDHSGQIPDRAVESGLIGFFGSIDPTEGGITSRTNANLQTYTTLGGGGLLKNQVFYTKYDFELYSNFTFFLEDPENGDQIRQKETRDIIGYNGSYSKPHYLANRRATFAAGAQYRHDFSRENELTWTTNRTENRERIQYGDINEANISLFATERVQLSRAWSLDVGLRFEHFINQYTDRLEADQKSSASATNVFPKLSLFYNPSSSVQLYLKTGRGFHSNDTRAVVPRQGKDILPAAYGSDLGALWKVGDRLLVHPALWYLWLAQEFVYVGDGGIVEPSGQSRRMGADLAVRYQISKRFFADLDLNVAQPRAIEEAAGEQFIPLAPTFTAVAGLSYINPSGLSGNIRARYLGSRPANEDNSIVAEGYFVADAQVTYSISRFIIGLHINNVFNTRWKETQFATESRLKDEPQPVEEIHFTPGSPFFGRLSLTYNF